MSPPCREGVRSSNEKSLPLLGLIAYKLVRRTCGFGQAGGGRGARIEPSPRNQEYCMGLQRSSGGVVEAKLDATWGWQAVLATNQERGLMTPPWQCLRISRHPPRRYGCVFQHPDHHGQVFGILITSLLQFDLGLNRTDDALERRPRLVLIGEPLHRPIRPTF